MSIQVALILYVLVYVVVGIFVIAITQAWGFYLISRVAGNIVGVIIGPLLGFALAIAILLGLNHLASTYVAPQFDNLEK